MLPMLFCFFFEIRKRPAYYKTTGLTVSCLMFIRFRDLQLRLFGLNSPSFIELLLHQLTAKVDYHGGG